MFDLPDAKRIRRSDVNRSRSSSPTSGNDTDTEAREALLQAKLAAIYGPLEFDVPSQSQSHSQSQSPPKNLVADGEAGGTGDGNMRETRSRRIGREGKEGNTRNDPNSSSDSDSNTEDDSKNTHRSSPPQEEQGQEYEFALFRPSNTTQQTIILLPPSTAAQEQGRILHPRPQSFYVTPKAEGDKRKEWEAAAVSGEDVLKGKERRHWGLEVRWRVRVLRAGETVGQQDKSNSVSICKPKSKAEVKAEAVVAEAEQQVPSAPQDPQTGLHGPLSTPGQEPKAKPKPNKKRRILLREKKRARYMAEAARKRAREGKEEAEKEKRTRRNREKKAKRRLKEKARKAEAGGGKEGDGVEGVDVGSE
ncbi:hypothetical protein BKA65DRAFT_485197 [Rhexocercosporidium sp. MPI-PUGE-AT-0058]|nr:hypothetical protein BKA65DRAFT_485197 [Rhexocercosporidium sp. MPI-PUGE-AT-0058]